MYHFIVNPIARGGRLKKEWHVLRDYIDNNLEDYNVHFTEYIGHATEIVRSLTNTHEPISIIAVGGDGTVNEVINGIENLKVTKFGYIPFGSGMDFARGNNIPLNPFKAIDIIAEGNLKSIKFSEVICDSMDSRRFASNCGIGFDATVSYEANIDKVYVKKFLNKINLGFLTYAVFVIKLLFTFKRLNFDVIIDGKSQKFDKSWFITFCNIPYVGGGMIMNPSANPTEDILDSTIVFGVSRLKFLTLFPTIFKGTHIHLQGVELLRGKQYEIRSNLPIEVHVDGEVVGRYKNFKVSLLTEWINLYV